MVFSDRSEIFLDPSFWNSKPLLAMPGHRVPNGCNSAQKQLNYVSYRALVRQLCGDKKMKNPLFKYIASISLGLGLMLSPDSLMRLGNGMGTSGAAFLLVVILTAMAHISTARQHSRVSKIRYGRTDGAPALGPGFGPVSAMVLFLCSKPVFAVCAATGILVTAGFAFNEIFLYWFPNFAFAFILLGALAIANLFGPRPAEIIQVVSVSATMASLLLLSFAALAVRPAADAGIAGGIAGSFSFNAVFVGMTLMLGYDLIGAGADPGTRSVSLELKAMILSLIVAAAVFCIWGLVSMLRVPSQQLATSSIPYTIAARNILGNTGRILIGIAIISGTCSAVNALFMAVPKMAGRIVPALPGKEGIRTPALVLMLAAGIGVMMAGGMAGSPDLEVYIKAGMLFWLLNYAAVHLAVVMTHRQQQKMQMTGLDHLLSLTVLLIFLSSVTGLIRGDSEPVKLICTMSVMAIVATAFSALWMHKRNGSKNNNNRVKKEAL
jgi:amino acid transporter